MGATTKTKTDADAAIARLRAVKSPKAVITQDYRTTTGKLPKDVVECCTRVRRIIRTMLGAISKGQWEIADEAYLLIPRYNEAEIRGMFMEEYEKEAGKIRESMSKEEYKKFRNEGEKVRLAVKIAFYLGSRYHETRISGRSFYSVLIEHEGNVRGLNKAIKNGMSKQAKEEARKKEEEELKDAVNVSDIKHVESSNYHPEKKEKEGWSAPPVDENKRWIKESKQIVRDEPMLFIRMIASCVKFNHLSQKVLDLITKELS